MVQAFNEDQDSYLALFYFHFFLYEKLIAFRGILYRVVPWERVRPVTEVEDTVYRRL